MINYRDDSNPLVVKLGTPGLKGHASTSAGMEYFSRGSGHSQKQWNASASFSYHHIIATCLSRSCTILQAVSIPTSRRM